MFKAVIFDCDGVLVDSESIIIGVWHQIALEAGGQIELDDLFARMTGQTMDTCRDIISNVIGREVDQAMRDLAWQEVGKRFKTDLQAFANVDATLALLTEKNLPIAVASNSEQSPLEYKLNKTQLVQYFNEHVYSAELVENGKPAPDVYLHAAAKLGIAPQDCLVIEDSPLGVAAGKAAGMTVWALNHASDDARLLDQGADKVLHSMAEVKELIAAL